MATQLPSTASNGSLDIDRRDQFDYCVSKLENVKTKNFFVRFNATKALCSVDIDDGRIALLLSETGAVDDFTTRWINFWGWNQDQSASLDVIAKRYGLSPRLMDLFWPKGSSPHPNHEKPMATPAEPRTFLNVRPASTSSTDIEKGVSTTTSSLSSSSASSGMPLFAQVIDHLWHFCSVDWGEHYLYIGFNALLTTAGRAPDVGSDRPAGHRIWTSLLLCDDGTVITIFENPPPNLENDSAVVNSIRRNVLNVFRHLSQLHMSSSAPSLSRVTIRPAHADRPATKEVRDEMASLLFYYLFDDWLTTYALIAQREHPYRAQLEMIRKRMFESADVALIESLHHLGRQLTVLKLMYKSKELIVRRILQRSRYRRNEVRTAHEAPNGFNSDVWNGPFSLDDSIHHSGTFDDQAGTEPWNPVNASEAGHRVSLSLSAVFRFERLLDRIQLLVQTEIDECMKEKESLAFMVCPDLYPFIFISVTYLYTIQSSPMAFFPPQDAHARD